MTLNIASVNGFHDLVQLSASGLPNGVSATFSPASVTPSGVATLYVDAAAAAPAAALQSLTITATGGGISHSTQASLTVNFGLVPICTGAFTGVVTDTETGLPIPNAIVGIGYGLYVDSNGRFNFTGLSLGQANAPVTYTVNSGADGYWYTSVSALAQCGVVTTVNIQLLPERFGHVIGTVYEGIPDPNNLSEARAVDADRDEGRRGINRRVLQPGGHRPCGRYVRLGPGQARSEQRAALSRLRGAAFDEPVT